MFDHLSWYQILMGGCIALAGLLLFRRFSPARADLREGWQLVKRNRGLVLGLVALTTALAAFIPALRGACAAPAFTPNLLAGSLLAAVAFITNFRGATRHLVGLLRKHWGAAGVIFALLALIGGPLYFFQFTTAPLPWSEPKLYAVALLPSLLFPIVSGAAVSLYITFRFLEVPPPLFWEQYSRRFVPYLKWAILTTLLAFGYGLASPPSLDQPAALFKTILPWFIAFVPLVLATRGGGLVEAFSRHLRLLQHHYGKFLGYFLTGILCGYALAFAMGWAQSIISTPLFSSTIIPLAGIALGNLLGFWLLASLVALYKRASDLDNTSLPDRDNTFHEFPSSR